MPWKDEPEVQLDVTPLPISAQFQDEDSVLKGSTKQNETSEKLNVLESDQKQNLNDFVTKVDPFAMAPNFKAKDITPSYDEQGQNTESIDNPVTKARFSSELNDSKGVIDRYVEKESLSDNFSPNKSHHSHVQSSSINESPAVDHQDEEENQSELHKAHLIQTLQAIQYIQTLPGDHSLEGKYIEFPPHPMFPSPESTKTIIFDLDETLVH